MSLVLWPKSLNSMNTVQCTQSRQFGRSAHCDDIAALLPIRNFHRHGLGQLHWTPPKRVTWRLWQTMMMLAVVVVCYCRKFHLESSRWCAVRSHGDNVARKQTRHGIRYQRAVGVLPKSVGCNEHRQKYQHFENLSTLHCNPFQRRHHPNTNKCR